MSRREIAIENQERFAYARDQGHLDFVNKATTCDRYVEGKHWDPETAARLDLAGKPIITINKTLTSLAALMGEQLANESDVQFKAADGGDQNTAMALDKVWINFAQQNNLLWLESEVAMDAFIRSRGFIDLRMRWDDNFRGDPVASLLNSKNVVVDPDASDYDPDKWYEVFVTKWLNNIQVERMYGKRFARELAQRPESAFMYNYDIVDWEQDTFGGRPKDVYAEPDNKRRRIYRIIERQYREIRNVECFVNPETGDMREVPENWDHNRISAAVRQFGWTIYRKPQEKIRWTTSVDDIVLFNDISPYKHFTPVPTFPFFRHGTTIGIVENMLSPQDLLNKATSQELHIVTQTANSGWILKHGTLMNMTLEELERRGGEDGLVISISGNPKTDLEKIKPNQVPTGLDRLTYKADEALKETSMVNDSVRGTAREDVAARAIREQKMSGAMSMAKPFANMSFSKRILVRNWLDLVQAFMSEERVIHTVGKTGMDEPESVTVNQVTPEGNVVNDLTLGEYGVVLTPAPVRASMEESQLDEAIRIKEAGVAIPDHTIVRNSNLSDKVELVDMMRQRDGMSDPSEHEQKLAQLDLQIREIEAAQGEADVALKQANTELAMAKAAAEGRPGDEGRTQGDEPALLKIATDRELSLKKIQADLEEARKDRELEWRKHQSSIRLERDKIEAGIDRAADEKKAKASEEKKAAK